MAEINWQECNGYLPDWPNRNFLTRWSDGDYEVVNAGDLPQFWQGIEVNGEVMTHWAEIEGPEECE